MAAAKRRDLSLTKTSAKDLREQAKRSSSSLEKAREEWRSVAPEELKNLPDAVEE